MPKNHTKFHSTDGKRLVLVVEDEIVNQQLLGYTLRNDYEVIFASSGEEAKRQLSRYQETLSLVLLDLVMPDTNGIDLLSSIKSDPDWRQIPVIVLTSDQSAEIDCLNLGAIDFIRKPYPLPEVILARIARALELSEDRQILESTERDQLTGLFNKEFFFSYAEQYDVFHADKEMDAIVIDINHFHLINERYGKEYGDQVLKRIGERIRSMVHESDGIVCRKENDTFLVYCPHRSDYKVILDNASIGLAGEGIANNNRIRLRMGVYSYVDKTIDIERRFDRAKNAADTVKNSFTKSIAIYDSTLHESELYDEQLIEGFHDAIEQKQFKVFYQPKFNIQSETPVLASAEALVRWIHPEMGMISPGRFIPLFENNGLIQQLDLYVWKEAAAQIRKWKKELGVSIPVSVNVSRVDMYDPNLVSTFVNIIAENDLLTNEFLLEITESAYTSDSNQIIEIVNRLRDIGFSIEMDDFGTGYSSLGMISRLPIDALKLDMIFIRNAFNENKETRLLELIIDIAKYLSVPIIAEGVETQEQIDTLKSMGCDIVQGYYFSKPVPANEFEHFVIEKREYLEEQKRLRASLSYIEKEMQKEMAETSDITYSRIASSLSQDYFSIYYVNIENDIFTEYSTQGTNHKLQFIRQGAEFFDDCKRTIPQMVAAEDIPMALSAFDKENLLKAVSDNKTYSIYYRLLIDGKMSYINLKALHIPEDEKHIVIGLTNIDEQVRRQQEFEQAKKESITYSRIAQALAKDYFSIYYVDVENDHFIEYSCFDSYNSLGIEKDGEDFFTTSQKNCLRVVYKEDQEAMIRALNKENLLKELAENGSFTFSYRLMFDGEPTYVSMKAIKLNDENGQHIVIGVNNIDAQMHRQMAYEESEKEKMTYSRIAQALSKDYYSIYYVDLETDEFIEYSSDSRYQQLQVEQSGTNFFENCRKNVLRLVYPDDLDKALAIWEKDKLLPLISDDKPYNTNYRILFNDKPEYVGIKVIRLTQGNESNHIIIGIRNINNEMERERLYQQELGNARNLVNRDALTGVKSKHAYQETEANMNERIQKGLQEDFAVVVCDLNGLKSINDEQGHAAGDKYIKSASSTICNIFKHSPVFRIGGDEFAVILSNSDYDHREALMDILSRSNAQNQDTGNNIVIASGISIYNKDEAKCVADVFERADKHMYTNKGSLKNS